MTDEERVARNERRAKLLREAGLSERHIKRIERREERGFRETPMDRLEKKHFLLAWILRKAFWVVPIVLFFSLCVDSESRYSPPSDWERCMETFDSQYDCRDWGVVPDGDY